MISQIEVANAWEAFVAYDLQDLRGARRPRPTYIPRAPNDPVRIALLTDASVLTLQSLRDTHRCPRDGSHGCGICSTEEPPRLRRVPARSWRESA